MEKSSDPGTLGRALEIIFRGTLETSVWMDPTIRADVVAHFLVRNEEDVRRKRTGRLKERLRETLRDLPPEMSITQQRRLFAEVEHETGLRLVDFIDRDSTRLKAILARGRIRGEADYRLVRSHVDVLEGDPDQAAALEEAYRLIGEFETRLMKPPQR